MGTITKDLGIATAYGYAVSKGYTGTEDEFAQLMANYATVGETATEAAQQAGVSADYANADALKAEGNAVGQQNGEDVDSDSPYYHNNAKYYADEAKDSETNAGLSEQAAGGSATSAETDALKSEGYAVGTQDGTAVASGSPYYQNNSKYYSEQSAASATASSAMTGLAPAFSLSKAYAVGDYVIYSGTLYKFTAAHAAGAWVGTDATAVTLAPDVADLKGALNTIASLTTNIAYSTTLAGETKEATIVATGLYPTGTTYTCLGLQENTSYLAVIKCRLVVNAIGSKIRVRPFLLGRGSSPNITNSNYIEITTTGTYDLEFSEFLEVTASKDYRIGVYLSNMTGTNNVTISYDCVALFADQADKSITDSVFHYGNQYQYPKYQIATIEDVNSILGNDFTVDCWGDSLTYGTGSTNPTGGYVSRLKAILGDEYNINNFGVGGESSRMIACRQGGMCPVVEPFVIPADTSKVEITLKANDGSSIQSMMSVSPSLNPVTINGILGKITITSSYNTHYFNRLESGSSVLVDRDTDVITSGSKRKRNTMIIFMGQNGGYDSNADTLVEQYRYMINHSGTDKYLCVGIISGSAALRSNVENAMFKAFGRHYINARAYMSHPIYAQDGTTITSCYSLADLGLTATSTDIEQIAVGTVPTRLTTDGTHLTDDGYDVLTNLIYNRGKELMYWN